MIGEINKELKQEIDNVQMYIDYLWETGREDLVPIWIKTKDDMCQKIGTEKEVEKTSQ